jgi:hypothetical protein
MADPQLGDLVFFGNIDNYSITECSSKDYLSWRVQWMTGVLYELNIHYGLYDLRNMRQKYLDFADKELNAS